MKAELDINEMLELVIKNLEFTESELELIKQKIMELVESGNEKILCMLLNKMTPDVQ